MVQRLLHIVISLSGTGGVLLALFALLSLPDDIARYEALARASEHVQARLVTKDVRADPFGEPSNVPRYNYTPVGTFEIVGREGEPFQNVVLDDGTLHSTAEEARQAAAPYQPGMVVDAWYDPRSRTDPVYFPLNLTNPAVEAEEMRHDRTRCLWIAGALLVVSATFAAIAFRRD
jgi:hypothetical protein